mmetsp:Transcript_28969/g.85992  ORF Transcript_28969/g.85992 Transcript_28969/m.85992 type:complete len:246 (-) Transcript_28969:115-852(-)
MHRAAARQVRVDLPRHDLHLGVQHADRAQGRHQGHLVLLGHAPPGEGRAHLQGGRQDGRRVVAGRPHRAPRPGPGHPLLRRHHAPLRRLQGAALPRHHDARGPVLYVSALRGQPRRPHDERPVGGRHQEGARGPQVRVHEAEHAPSPVLDRGPERPDPHGLVHRVRRVLRLRHGVGGDELPQRVLGVPQRVRGRRDQAPQRHDDLQPDVLRDVRRCAQGLPVQLRQAPVALPGEAIATAPALSGS